MVEGKANSRHLVSWGLGAEGWDREEPDPTSSPSDAFDFNYGVCVMRMREGLNVSEVMQAHSEYTPHLLACLSKARTGAQKVLEPDFF